MSSRNFFPTWRGYLNKTYPENMPFLTICTSTKPFTNPHIRTIQRNAIRSWQSLGEQVEVLLFGREAGMAEAAADLGARPLPEVACNEEGLPLLNAMFDLARQANDSPVLMYTNADMLFLPDLLDASRMAASLSDRFLLVGQRWDLEVRQPLDFSPGWAERLQADRKRLGKLHPPLGSDFFVFPRNCFTNIPAFTVGRSAWDNWMIYSALKEGLLTLDATPSLTAIHQNHDYSHLEGNRPPYHLEASEVNRRLAGGKSHLYLILDIDNQLAGGQVRPTPLTLNRLIRRMELRLYPKEGDPGGIRGAFIRRLRRLRRGVI